MFYNDLDVVVLEEVVARQDRAVGDAHVGQTLLHVLISVVVGICNRV